MREPGKNPGKLIVTLVQQKHSIYKRRNSNLFTVIPLNLQEIEYGCQKTITTLDGRKRSVTNVNQNYFDTVLGEGMPIYGSNCEKGQLFIKYEMK